MNNIRNIINECVQNTVSEVLYEQRINDIISEQLKYVLNEKKKKKRRGQGSDTIERANRKAYNSDIINGSELARRAHITKSKNDDTLRSLASKLWGKNKNARKPSKKQNKKMNAQVNKL